LALFWVINALVGGVAFVAKNYGSSSWLSLTGIVMTVTSIYLIDFITLKRLTPKHFAGALTVGSLVFAAEGSIGINFPKHLALTAIGVIGYGLRGRRFKAKENIERYSAISASVYGYLAAAIANCVASLGNESFPFAVLLQASQIALAFTVPIRITETSFLDHGKRIKDENLAVLGEIATILNEKENLVKERSRLLRVLCHDVLNSMTAIQALFFAYENRPNKVKPKKDVAFWDLIESLVLRARSITDSQVATIKSIEKASTNGTDEFLGVDLRPISLKECFDVAFYIFENKLVSKSLKVKLDISEDHWAVADKNILSTHVLGNILSNAIKFSIPGSLITVSSQQKGPWVSLIIADQGVGMAKEEVLAVLAGKYPVNSRTGTANEQGLGMGISIAKKAAEACHGKLEIESVVGKSDERVGGTVVTITLKAARAEAKMPK
jgi:signal transduction histidine kinase